MASRVFERPGSGALQMIPIAALLIANVLLDGRRAVDVLAVSAGETRYACQKK